MRFLFIITSLLLRLVEDSWEIARGSFSFRCETFFRHRSERGFSRCYRIQFREKQDASKKYLNIVSYTTPNVSSENVTLLQIQIFLSVKLKKNIY